ncbi:MAG: inorganic diphosphatase [Candidatus Paceibacterota bacterium]|jgi:inorganic pyrophosphatase
MSDIEQKPTSQFENFLGQTIKIKIDRALGTKHPKHDFIYEANYGFVPGVMAPDGEDLDAYVLGISEPVQEFEGQCVAIIHRLNDDDDKLVIVLPEAENITDEEIRQATNFQEQFFKSIIIRKGSN